MPNETKKNQLHELPAGLHEARQQITDFSKVYFGFLQKLMDQHQTLFDPRAGQEIMAELRRIGDDAESQIKQFGSTVGAKLQQDITRGASASPEDLKAIGTAADRALALGESDITSFIEDTVNNIVQRVAPARGLRAGDTPILQQISREAVTPAQRAQSDLVNTIRGQQAQAELTVPLQRRQADIAGAGALANIQQVALTNRLAVQNSLADIFNRGSQTGLQLAGLGGQSSANQIAGLTSAYGPLLGSYVDQDVGRGGFFGSPGGQVFGSFMNPQNIGGLAMGIGGLAPFFQSPAAGGTG